MLQNRLYAVAEADQTNNALYTDDIEDQIDNPYTTAVETEFEDDLALINTANNYGYLG
jgi:hypothetical protein